LENTLSTNGPTIPPDVAAHVLFHYGCEGGYQAGSFTEQLLTTIAMADEANTHRLSLGFPEYVAAVTAIQYDPDGVERLQRIAKGEVSDEESPGPQCPEALFNPDTDGLRRCIQDGRHEDHQTADGTQWHIPVNTTAEVPF
jgi:hypothetical protein